MLKRLKFVVRGTALLKKTTAATFEDNYFGDQPVYEIKETASLFSLLFFYGI